MLKNSYQNLKQEDSLHGHETQFLGRKIFPLVRIVWEITSRCNLECKFCCIGDCRENDITDEAAISISRNIAESAPFEVTITGGEPLLRKNLKDVITILSKSDIDVSLNTNGVLLTKVLAEELYGTGVRRLRIGLDGSSPLTNDHLRGKGSFSKIVSAITIAVNTGFNVSVSSLVTKVNLAEVEQLIEFVRSIGVDDILFNDFKIAGNARKNDAQLSISAHDDLVELGNLIKGTKEKYKEFVQWSEDPSLWLKLGEIDQFEQLVKSGGRKGIFGVCGAGSISLSIKSNGEVVPCLFMREYVCGNALNEKITDIWTTSGNLKALRDMANKPMKEFTDECKTCSKNTLCVGKCPAKIYSAYKRFDNLRSCVLEVR